MPDAGFGFQVLSEQATMQSALGLLPFQNFDMYHQGYALVGRTVQVGAVTGIVAAYNQMEDTFNIQFQLTGPVMKFLADSSAQRTVLRHSQWTKEDDKRLEAAQAVNALFRAAHGIDNGLSWLPLAAAAAAAAAAGTTLVDRSVVSKPVPYTPVKPVEILTSNESAATRPELSHQARIEHGKKLLATTKTGVFKLMHSCYRSMSGINGRQDAYYGANSVPTYEDIEAALETDATINTARISTLRSRYLMAATLQEVKQNLPCEPEKYVINSITTACPMCGRAIALNKLASHENWCKHLECSHGSTGASIAARFRAFDKNSPAPPQISTSFTDWVFVDKRNDMAPLDLQITERTRNLVPFTSHIHWHAVMFHQLMVEEALSADSILVQELVVKGIEYYGLNIDAESRFRSLFNFQKELSKFSLTFSAYAKEHVDVINMSKPDVLPSVSWSEMIRAQYKAHETSYPSFESIEQAINRVGGKQAVNALRVLVLRNRQILKSTFEVIGYKGTCQISDFVVNAYITCCPLCNEEVRASSCDLGDDSLCLHFESAHGNLGKQLANVYRHLDKSQGGVPQISSGSLNLPQLKVLEVRPDLAKVYAHSFGSGIIPLRYECIDWKGLVFDNLLTNHILSPCSVLTQEIVVIGLFYFGLVNQRSPQKFGQYPQLQTFQKGLHEFSSTGYDLYCGAGIKEGELGSSHTRGRPVQATKDVISRYHHYGLSHKSLQRNDRKRQSPKNTRSNAKFPGAKGQKRKNVKRNTRPAEKFKARRILR